MSISSCYTKPEFKKLPTDLRIGIIISDGVWYSFTKWQKLAHVTEEELDTWIEEKLATGVITQAKNGNSSYRMTSSSLKTWRENNGFQENEQIVDFVFPPRIWDGMTETEGFLSTPRREVGIVSVLGTKELALALQKELRGIARVKEHAPNHYKIYGLDANYIRSIAQDVINKFPQKDCDKIYSRAVAQRRELVDFTPEFTEKMLDFYRNFGKILVKSSTETINIFIPDPDDQETQVLMWVVTAIEKFNQTAAVPFVGYLNSVLKRWPYELPHTHLGKELSAFQRIRGRALKTLRKNNPNQKDFNDKEIFEKIQNEYSFTEYKMWEERHRIWTASQSSVSLIREESGEEQVNHQEPTQTSLFTKQNTDFSHKLSLAIVQAAIETQCYNDALKVIPHIGEMNVRPDLVHEISDDFIQTLGSLIGVREES